MRAVVILALLTFVAVPFAFASGPSQVPNAQQVSAMAARAAKAKPNDRCYLYAKLVHAVSLVIGRDVSRGNVADTSSSLKEIRAYTAAINRNMTRKSKRLLEAQVILRRTAFRLKEMMMNASLSQQPNFRSTLAQMNQTQAQMMLAVLQK